MKTVTYIYINRAVIEWTCIFSEKNNSYVKIRKNPQGDTECGRISSSVAGCSWFGNIKECKQLTPYNASLTCGDDHLQKYGTTGYDTTGHWCNAEIQTVYPRYANGASGYIISRPIAEYIAKNYDRLENYVLEDASTGIWIDEANFESPVNYVSDFEKFYSGGDWKRQLPICEQKNTFIIGHKLTPEMIKTCHSFLK